MKCRRQSTNEALPQTHEFLSGFDSRAARFVNADCRNQNSVKLDTSASTLRLNWASQNGLPHGSGGSSGGTIERVGKAQALVGGGSARRRRRAVPEPGTGPGTAPGTEGRWRPARPPGPLWPAHPWPGWPVWQACAPDAVRHRDAQLARRARPARRSCGCRRATHAAGPRAQARQPEPSTPAGVTDSGPIKYPALLLASDACRLISGPTKALPKRRHHPNPTLSRWRRRQQAQNHRRGPPTRLRHQLSLWRRWDCHAARKMKQVRAP